MGENEPQDEEVVNNPTNPTTDTQNQPSSKDDNDLSYDLSTPTDESSKSSKADSMKEAEEPNFLKQIMQTMLANKNVLTNEQVIKAGDEY